MRFAVTIYSAEENVRSEQADVAGILKYIFANSASLLYLSV